jgi:hypothetical protein
VMGLLGGGALRGGVDAPPGAAHAGGGPWRLGTIPEEGDGALPEVGADRIPPGCDDEAA